MAVETGKKKLFRFYLMNFQSNTDFSSLFCGFFFTVKSPSVTQSSVSQENAFKKSKNPVALLFPAKLHV